MFFPVLDVINAIKEFEIYANDLINATPQTYQSSMKDFIGLVRNDKIINHILKPFLEMTLDFSEIEESDPTDPSGGRLKLPKDMNKQIAYVLQTLNKSYKDEFSIEKYAYHFFHEENKDEALHLLNEQVIKPNLNTLKAMLVDFFRNEIKGKKEVPESDLQLFK